jgi:tRNA A37 threonylcarbamoyladenosine synthetase subunit TsaC/SUA5/YrdC
MKTRIVREEDVDMEELIEYFSDVVALPTETVYGLSGNIYNEHAIRKIFEVKNRPRDNPLIVHVSSINMLKTIIAGDIPTCYQK